LWEERETTPPPRAPPLRTPLARPCKPPGGVPAAAYTTNIPRDAMSVTAHEFTEMVELIFHNVEYLLTVAAVEGDTLCIEVERKDDGSRWRGDFTSRYIEDITGKTGNFKKYPVFVKMLLSAITEESESVFVDLLTYADLEMLKNRKGRSQAAPPSRAHPPGNNKRYLILTYAAEFDRVHYPLPLLFEENPEPAALQATIRRLRSEVESLKEGGAVAAGGGYGRGSAEMAAAESQAEVRRAREQIKQLQKQVEWLEENHEGGGGAGMAEHHALQQQVRAQEREIRHLRKEREAMAHRIEAREGELESSKAAHKRTMARKQRDYETLDNELAKRREAERELRIKVRDLTSELERTQRAGGARVARAPRDPAGVYARSGSPSRGSNYGGSRNPSPSRGSSRGPSPSPTRSRARAPAPAPPTRSRTPPARATSPARSTGSTGSRGKRPSSAPTGRFDPTAYIEEQKARREESARRRGMTPPASGRSTPTGSRPGSARGARGASPAGSRQSSRRGSAAASPAWSEDEREVAHVTRARAAAHASPRAGSPGRALQDVKQRLTQYQNVRAGQQQQGARPASKVGPGKQRTGSSASSPSRRPAKSKAPGAYSESEGEEYAGRGQGHSEAYNDASSEIADIDSRLHALQSFLRQAKAA